MTNWWTIPPILEVSAGEPPRRIGTFMESRYQACRMPRGIGAMQFKVYRPSHPTWSAPYFPWTLRLSRVQLAPRPHRLSRHAPKPSLPANPSVSINYALAISLSLIAWSCTAPHPSATSSESIVETKNIPMNAIIEPLASLQGPALAERVPCISQVVDVLLQVLTILDVSVRLLSQR